MRVINSVRLPSIVAAALDGQRVRMKVRIRVRIGALVRPGMIFGSALRPGLPKV